MSSLTTATRVRIRDDARQRAGESDTSEAPFRPVEHQFVDVVEAERRRLGREFHDGLGQRLTSLALSAAILTQKLETAERPEASDARRLVEQIDETVREARSLIRGLYPAWLAQNGLEKTLSELLARVTEVSKRETELVVSEGWQPVTDPDEAMHIFRIIQEAVNNALKHSECEKIVVLLENVDERRRIEISDDGIGLSQRDPNGYGFRLMHYRASLLGGRMTIGPGRGHGTSIELALDAADVSH